MGHVVTASYVTLRVKDHNDAWVVGGFYKGAALPAAADPEALAALVAKGMVEQAPEPELAAKAGEPVAEAEKEQLKKATPAKPGDTK